MDDLTAFLKARLDEDEQAARWAVRESSFRERGLGEEWEAVRTGPEMRELVVQTRPKAFRPHRVVGGLDPLLDGAVAAHIARHDPDRVLREVEAKRKLIDAIVAAEAARLGPYPMELNIRLATDLLSLLALPYADHPSFKEEWRP
jgi:hypothetical protein